MGTPARILLAGLTLSMFGAILVEPDASSRPVRAELVVEAKPARFDSLR